jgi:hypothetical protein
MPCSEPSNSERWVAAGFAGNVLITAKPWFWLVIITTSRSRSCTGWLAPWWPNFILPFWRRWPEPATDAQTDAKHRHVRSDNSLDRCNGVITGLGSPGPLDRNTPSGSSPAPQQPVFVPGTTVTCSHDRQHAQDVALNAKVVGHHMETAAGTVMTRSQLPAALIPLIALAAVTSLARSMPTVRESRAQPASQRFSPLPSAATSAPAIRQPFWAPLSRRIRVRRRVSISAMATTPCSLSQASSACSLRQLLGGSGTSRMIRPASCMPGRTRHHRH